MKIIDISLVQGLFFSVFMVLFSYFYAIDIYWFNFLVAVWMS